MSELLRAAVLGGVLLATVSTGVAAPSNDDCVDAKEVETLPFRHVVDLTAATAEPGDRFIWKWVAGEATALGDFGDPVSGDSFKVCVYDDDPPVLRTKAAVLGGGTCAGLPCWKALGDGHRYVEKSALNEGVSKLVLKSGGAGQAKVVLKGKGARLLEGLYDDVLLPLVAPVRVQLVGSAGACWEATYDTRVATNTSALFQASPD